VTVFGNNRFRSETLVAYELGYRAALTKKFSWDVASFYNVYHDLETTEPSTPFFELDPSPAHIVVAQHFGNLLYGETYGAEVEASWSVLSSWSFSGSYSRLKIQLHPDPLSGSHNSEMSEHTSPEHQAQLRSHLALPRNLNLDAAVERVSALRALAIPSHTRVDAQMGWQATEFTALTVGVQNLLTPHHIEFGNYRQISSVGQAERNIYVKLLCRF
jgi:iron complex outermembrane receptor protein